MPTPSPSRNNAIIGFSLAIFGAILFSAKGILIKYAYEDGLSTETVMLYRMLLSLPFFLYVGIRSAPPRATRSLSGRDRLKMLYCGIFGFYLSTWLSFYSLHFISVQLERIILFSYPALVVAGAALIGRTRPSARMTLATLLTYLGVTLVFGHEYLSADTAGASASDIAMGSMLVGLSTVFFASYVLVSKSFIVAYGSAFFTASTMSISTVAIIVHSGAEAVLSGTTGVLLPGMDAFVLLGVLAIVGTVMPTFMMSEAVARIGPERMAISGTFGPVATSMIAVIALGEVFTGFHATAILLCSVGVMLISVQGKPPKSAQRQGNAAFGSKAGADEKAGGRPARDTAPAE